MSYPYILGRIFWWCPRWMAIKIEVIDKRFVDIHAGKDGAESGRCAGAGGVTADDSNSTSFFFFLWKYSLKCHIFWSVLGEYLIVSPHVSTDTHLQEVIRSYDSTKVSRNLQLLPSCISRYMRWQQSVEKSVVKNFSFWRLW